MRGHAVVVAVVVAVRPASPPEVSGVARDVAAPTLAATPTGPRPDATPAAEVAVPLALEVPDALEVAFDVAAGDTPAVEAYELDLEPLAPPDHCRVRPTAGGVVARCDSGAMRCEVIARGELAEDPGEELVARCDHARGPVAVVIASPRRVLWSERVDRNEDLPGGTCGELRGVSAEPVAIAGAPWRGVLLRVRGCSEPGVHLDTDTVLFWRGAAFGVVASESFTCDDEGETDDGRPSLDGRGGYLTRGPTTPDTVFNVVGCEACAQREVGADRVMLWRGRPLRTLRCAPRAIAKRGVRATDRSPRARRGLGGRRISLPRGGRVSSSPAEEIP